MIGSVGRVPSPFALDQVNKHQEPQKTLIAQQNEKENDKTELQERKQTLENQLLLTKSSTDGAAVSEEIQKKLEEELKKIADELQVANHQGVSEEPNVTQFSYWQMRVDSYEPQPEEPPSGLYEVSADENGNQVITFDDPQKETNQETPATVKTTINTDQVDREIEQLRQAQTQLQQQIAMADSKEEKTSLEAELAQLERTLQEKDNEAYRRQHAVVQQGE